VVGHPQGTALTKRTALMRVARGPVPSWPPTLAAPGAISSVGGCARHPAGWLRWLPKL